MIDRQTPLNHRPEVLVGPKSHWGLPVDFPPAAEIGEVDRLPGILLAPLE